MEFVANFLHQYVLNSSCSLLLINNWAILQAETISNATCACIETISHDFTISPRASHKWCIYRPSWQKQKKKKRNKTWLYSSWSLNVFIALLNSFWTAEIWLSEGKQRMSLELQLAKFAAKATTYNPLTVVERLVSGLILAAQLLLIATASVLITRRSSIWL